MKIVQSAILKYLQRR